MNRAADRPLVDRYLRVVGIAVAAIALLMIGASVALLLIAGSPAAYLTGEVALDVTGVVAYLPWVAAGLVLVLRLPRLPIGWILLVPATGTALQSLAGRAIIFTHVFQNRPTLITEVLAAVGDALWVPGVAAGFIALMVLYPDGRPLGRGWRWILWITYAVAAVYALVTLFVRAPLYYLDSVDNPLELIGNPEMFEVGQTVPFLVLFLGGVPAGIAALTVRWRRGGQLERGQIKWLLWAALIQVLGIVVSIVGSEVVVDAPVQGGWTGVIGDAASVALPIAIVIAVSRYRLYEIDRIVSRTVSYGLIVGVLAGVYLSAVFVTQAVLPGERSDLAVAASTLAVAALFNPLRRRVHSQVDRRFNRSRYDAALVVDELAARLRDHVELETVTTDVLGATGRALQPVSLSVWVRR